MRLNYERIPANNSRTDDAWDHRLPCARHSHVEDEFRPNRCCFRPTAGSPPVRAEHCFFPCRAGARSSRLRAVRRPVRCSDGPRRRARQAPAPGARPRSHHTRAGCPRRARGGRHLRGVWRLGGSRASPRGRSAGGRRRGRRAAQGRPRAVAGPPAAGAAVLKTSQVFDSTVMSRAAHHPVRQPPESATLVLFAHCDTDLGIGNHARTSSKPAVASRRRARYCSHAKGAPRRLLPISLRVRGRPL